MKGDGMEAGAFPTEAFHSDRRLGGKESSLKWYFPMDLSNLFVTAIFFGSNKHDFTSYN